MRIAIVLFAVLGTIVSALALKVHYDDPGKEPCSINDKWDCGVVNHSPYADVKGVPVALIGLLGYLVLGILAWSGPRELMLAGAAVGLGFSLELTAIEATVLGVYCLYCVISLGLIALMAALSLGYTITTRRRSHPA